MKFLQKNGTHAYLSHALILAVALLTATYAGVSDRTPLGVLSGDGRGLADRAAAFVTEEAIFSPAGLPEAMVGLGYSLTADLYAPVEASAAVAVGPAVSAAGFIWPAPASNRISNQMSPRHPKGIDIGLSHAPGSPILAAADGVVEFAGGRACCSYGLYVIVDHGNGLKTLYSHLAGIEVYAGQPVSRGDHLGPAGSTGIATGVHLHFEVIQDGEQRNPIDYLPAPPSLKD